jgi:hypothetical protein
MIYPSKTKFFALSVLSLSLLLTASMSQALPPVQNTGDTDFTKSKFKGAGLCTDGKIAGDILTPEVLLVDSTGAAVFERGTGRPVLLKPRVIGAATDYEQTSPGIPLIRGNGIVITLAKAVTPVAPIWYLDADGNPVIDIGAGSGDPRLDSSGVQIIFNAEVLAVPEQLLTHGGDFPDPASTTANPLPPLFLAGDNVLDQDGDVIVLVAEVLAEAEILELEGAPFSVAPQFIVTPEVLATGPTFTKLKLKNDVSVVIEPLPFGTVGLAGYIYFPLTDDLIDLDGISVDKFKAFEATGLGSLAGIGDVNVSIFGKLKRNKKTGDFKTLVGKIQGKITPITGAVAPAVDTIETCTFIGKITGKKPVITP